ncbi:MAG: hypothetical protein AAF720_09955 [Pseudomonadota bacterium]
MRNGKIYILNTSALEHQTIRLNQTVVLERFADKCDRLSAKEARPNKDLERRSDSIGTQKALDSIFLSAEHDLTERPRSYLEPM